MQQMMVDNDELESKVDELQTELNLALRYDRT